MSIFKQDYSENGEYAFPRKLKKLMKRDGVSQEKLAAFLGIKRQNVGYYLQGKSSPDLKTVVEISNYFHVSTDYLLTKTGVEEPYSDFGAAANYIGLSEAEMMSLIETKKLYSDGVNYLLGSFYFQQLCMSISDLLEARKAADELSGSLNETLLEVIKDHPELKGRLKILPDVKSSEEAKKIAHTVFEMLLEQGDMQLEKLGEAEDGEHQED